jgi:hypothetical protein
VKTTYNNNKIHSFTLLCVFLLYVVFTLLCVLLLYDVLLRLIQIRISPKRGKCT